MTETASNILDFWFDQPRSKWFGKNPDFDAEIRGRFVGTITDISRDPDAWLTDPERALAGIIALDQFTRNAFRDSAQMYAHDAVARGLTKVCVANGWDAAFDPTQRSFVYMPLMHAESADDQMMSIACFRRFAQDTQTETSEKTLHHAVRHKVIIDRFGRYPHRNAILGRPSTQEELEFLQQPGSSF